MSRTGNVDFVFCFSSRRDEMHKARNESEVEQSGAQRIDFESSLLVCKGFAIGMRSSRSSIALNHNHIEWIPCSCEADLSQTPV